jgi:pimeloyl-ACP methyl ester carboxylesterase
MTAAESEVTLLPAFGTRPDRNDDLRPESLGRVLAERLLKEAHRPVVLLGHSASCQIVVHAAAARPGVVSALVLVGPTTDPRAQSWLALAQRWLRTAAHEDPRQVRMLVRLYGRNGVRQMLRAMDAARDDDIRQSLDRVTCPVLVLRGRRDRICPEDWAHALVRMGAQDWRGETLDAGAHMVPITHGSDTAAAINRFLLTSA